MVEGKSEVLHFENAPLLSTYSLFCLSSPLLEVGIRSLVKDGKLVLQVGYVSHFGMFYLRFSLENETTEFHFNIELVVRRNGKYF